MSISSLLHYSLKEDKSDKFQVEVARKRKKETELVFPTKFTAYTKNQRHVQVFDAYLIKKKEKFKFLYEHGY